MNYINANICCAFLQFLWKNNFTELFDGGEDKKICIEIEKNLNAYQKTIYLFLPKTCS